MKNLFKKQSAKFVQNPSSFTKVITKHILVCFLCPTVYKQIQLLTGNYQHICEQQMSTEGCDVSL